MLALVLDTSTPAVTAGLVDLSDLSVLAEAVQVDGRRHGELLALNLREVLRAGDPDVVVVGVGPGPFTGLRVGIVTAAAFAEARGLPVHGVCSLDGLAAPATGAVTDARRKEVYWAVYDEAAQRVDGPHVTAPALAQEALQGMRVVGDGAQLYGFATEELPRYPQVTALARASLTQHLPLTPLYLRRPDAVPQA
ncbi:MAG TPA: tRNA (adenosine(37)-N6)-threonylcarbamoyltransferase complex dimerization subunit type 1 TsaB [Mycobacteriales bacterium]|nr:tRNA (adenosine(37)-N6)-threonylcarbamoyltransferase complex dimerization subunit type 1 TsaB [Mycobacteriales bacterium]